MPRRLIFNLKIQLEFNLNIEKAKQAAIVRRAQRISSAEKDIKDPSFVSDDYAECYPGTYELAAMGTFNLKILLENST